MNYKLKNLLTYQKSQQDYALAFAKLKSILKPHFENISVYHLIENTFIDILMSLIRYYDDNKNVSNIKGILNGLTFSFKLEEKPFDKITNNIITEILKETNDIKNDFNCLKYCNQTSFVLKNQSDFDNKVYYFLEEVGIWKVKPDEGMDKWLNEWEEDGWYEWQYEYDIEYFEILNIVYHCNELEEINDVYKLVWYLYLKEIHPQGIHPEAKIIWENLSYWKKIIDNELPVKVIQNQPEEVEPELDALDDQLSMEEKLEALKRKFSR